MFNNPDTRGAPQRLSLAGILLPAVGEGAENQVHRYTLKNYDLSRGGTQPPPIHRPEFEVKPEMLALIKQNVCHLHRDMQGGFEGPPPTNYRTSAAGEGTMNLVTTLPWAIVCFLAHIIRCVNRRRTKGPLAQPFDTCD